MRSRIRKVATFLAFNLLFFALYLNFVHADAQLPQDNSAAPYDAVPAFGETELVKNPEKYLQQPAAVKGTATKPQ